MLTLAIGMPSGFEWIIVMAIGLLIFGKRLPEVGRSLGKGIVEFKKGLKGVEDDITQVDDQPATATRPQITTAAPNVAAADTAPKYKFDPETGKSLTPDSVSTSEGAQTDEHHAEVSHGHQ